MYANHSSIDAPVYPMSYSAYLGTGIYVAFVGILATIGNIVVILVIFSKRKEINFQKKQHIPLLLNIAIADIGVSVFGYPFTCLSGFAGRWLFTDDLCTMAGFFCFLLSLVSLSSLVAISIIRYIVICKPELKARLTPKKMGYVVLFTWLFGLSWAVTPLFGPAAYTYEAFGTSCSINWTRGLFQDIVFIIVCDILCFVIPIIIIAACYVQIIWRYRVISAPSISCYDTSNSLSKLKARRDMRVTWLILVQVGAFIIVWTPYVVVSGLYLVLSLPAWVTLLPTMFAKLSCAINPIAYSLLNKTFRRMSRDILCKCALRKVNHSSEKYNANVWHIGRTTTHQIFCVTGSVTDATNTSTWAQDDSLVPSVDTKASIRPLQKRREKVFERAQSMPPEHYPGDNPNDSELQGISRLQRHNERLRAQRAMAMRLLTKSRNITPMSNVTISNTETTVEYAVTDGNEQSVNATSIADIILTPRNNTCAEYWRTGQSSCGLCGSPYKHSNRRHSD